MRTALFWVITQRVVVITTDVSAQPIGPFSRVKNLKKKDCWPLKVLTSVLLTFRYNLSVHLQGSIIKKDSWPLKVVPKHRQYRCFGTTYRSIFKCQEFKKRFLTLEGCAETSVINYRRFSITYRSIFKGRELKKDSWPLKVVPKHW